MNTNLYHEFQDHHSFTAIKKVVETLDTRLPTAAPDAYDAHEDTIESILTGLSWSDLNRNGESTMWEETYAPYEYERPGFRLYIQPAFDSETTELKETVVRATVGNEIGRSLPSEDNVCETVKITVHEDGRIEQD